MTIFCELSLNGYLLKDNFKKECLTKEQLVSNFKKYKKDFIISCALKEDNKIYNASIVFENSKISFIHKKINLPNYNLFEESRYFYEGENINTFTWRGNKCSILICEDAWNDDILNDLKNQNIKYIFIPSNSPARGFYIDKLQIENKWEKIQKDISVKTNAYTFFVNKVGFEDGLGFWGGSKVSNPQGKIISKLELFEVNNLEVIID